MNAIGEDTREIISKMKKIKEDLNVSRTLEGVFHKELHDILASLPNILQGDDRPQEEAAFKEIMREFIELRSKHRSKKTKRSDDLVFEDKGFWFLKTVV
jgi:seryl-tRNA synthetase